MAVEWIDFGKIAREVAEAPKGFPTGEGAGVEYRAAGEREDGGK